MSDLHDELDALCLTSPAIIVAVHALIDLGLVTALECMKPECRRSSRKFINGGRRNPDGLSIDHIKMQRDGGLHRPENIRLVHYSCNCAWRTGIPHTEETKAKLRKAHLGRHSSPEACLGCGRIFIGPRGVTVHRTKTGCGL